MRHCCAGCSSLHREAQTHARTLADDVAAAHDRLIVPVAQSLERRLFENAGRLSADDLDVAYATVGAHQELQVDPAVDAALAREVRKLRHHVAGARKRALVDIDGGL